MSISAILRDSQYEIYSHPQTPIIGMSKSTEELYHSHKRFNKSLLRNSSSLENTSLLPSNIITFNDWNSFMSALNKVQNLVNWAENWQDLESLAPHSDTIILAQKWLRELFNLLNNEGLGWIEPNVTVGSDCDVVLEWWYGVKQLVMYIKAYEPIMYLKVWGADTNSEMADGYLNTIYEIFSFWEWLKSDK